MNEPAQPLPHDDYIGEVADALEMYDVRPGMYWTEDDSEGRLVAVFRDWPAGTVDPDTWPHTPYLAWDQYAGWQLIEDGGGRNIRDLDPEGVRTYSSPRQVACSLANALHGYLVNGPITNDGSWSWDSRPLEAAVKAWEKDG
ncbi:MULTISPECIES: hypothetical protein [Streptomyces rochei group]|uniref:hypothetical protein n=1 Tax=Streptomyces rochei group TaxID=2867164 RepID=UPI0019A3892F|nr:hypothetical protein [Streptomyces vinaceusdrappus]GHC37199.1 hypothetical protein GCM10010308_64700 [Streptomyces vinaceusdrappus]